MQPRSLGEGHERSPAPISIFTSFNDDDSRDPFRHVAALGYAAVHRTYERSELSGDIARSAVAMVCVGTGSPDDVKVFREATNGAPVYVIAATGGGAATLARSESNQEYLVIDEFIEKEMPLPRFERNGKSDDDPEEETSFPPVALSAHWIVEQLIRRRDDNGSLQR